MEAPNIQLYDLLRHELRMSDGKSLEFMRVLDKEYKSGVKEDLQRFEKTMTEGFMRMDNRFEKVDARFDKVDARFDAQDKRLDNLDAHIVRLDNKIDLTRHELRVDIRDSRIETMKWMIGIFLAIVLMVIGGLYFKK